MFKKSLVPGLGEDLIEVAFDLQIYAPDQQNDDGTIREGELPLTTVTVAHYFSRPTAAQREQLVDAVQGSKAKKAVAGTVHFWDRCCRKVAGYDDLEADFTNEIWKSYFHDAVGQEHIQTACAILLGRIGGEETDSLKK
jgi:hypothetical protein